MSDATCPVKGCEALAHTEKGIAEHIIRVHPENQKYEQIARLFLEDYAAQEAKGLSYNPHLGWYDAAARIAEAKDKEDERLRPIREAAWLEGFFHGMKSHRDNVHFARARLDNPYRKEEDDRPFM